MAWLFLILAVIMLGPFYFWLLKFLALIFLALMAWNPLNNRETGLLVVCLVVSSEIKGFKAFLNFENEN